jgi:acyl-CoA synthetase (AMP-forming)/AMP-acid ligase II
MLVQSFLEQSALKRPDKTALVCGGERYTYAEVNAMADKAAAALSSQGLAKGDRAVVFLDNSVEAVVSLFAILKSGGCFLMVNPTMKAKSSPTYSPTAGGAFIGGLEGRRDKEISKAETTQERLYRRRAIKSDAIGTSFFRSMR